ncbi:hypothetical protein JCM15457_1493 [Liquorilactobacillus sucicola DSM 21376 = JCM 15457]|uniref:GGDEF domain-containing protein n=1 Tax=Liquorilactobacillus sucicola DSM 21376 = JCM 15457 TaxID=1423806 RepID=A0A023CXL2_9LACO|nr:hypothetical protein [Liquorilactobacillus sucicola]KRN07065.1 hypothetical protein FD15_GL000633 [Liquorilactobacillus sucicola DSM 21376 = JCM 15457]GAJ26559.1 hypothetical protein JCM15457_1493 [Liquorilactobacillus sucicola DSM 21376 = JCM 15457]
MRKLFNFFKYEYAVVLLAVMLILLLYLTQEMFADVFWAVSILSLLGLISAFVLSDVLLTWFVILVVMAGTFTMMAGIVYLPHFERGILIFTLPLFSGLGALIKSLGGVRESALSNKSNIISYTNHVNSVTKLKNKENAARFYERYVSFIKNMDSKELTVAATCINWAHSNQYRQQNYTEYKRVLKEIADILKIQRLPDEVICYIDSGNFLIFSSKLENELKKSVDRRVKEKLSEIKYQDQGIKHDLQYKYAYQAINHKNVNEFGTFRDLTNNLKRQLETRIVVEYQ